MHVILQRVWPQAAFSVTIHEVVTDVAESVPFITIRVVSVCNIRMISLMPFAPCLTPSLWTRPPPSLLCDSFGSTMRTAMIDLRHTYISLRRSHRLIPVKVTRDEMCWNLRTWKKSTSERPQPYITSEWPGPVSQVSDWPKRVSQMNMTTVGMRDEWP